MNWYDHYRDRLNDKYIKHIETKYDYFISRIENHLTAILENNRVTDINLIELGAGCSNISIILYDRLKAKYPYRIFFHAMEKDYEMFKLSSYNIKDRNINLILHDILKMDYQSFFKRENTKNIYISHGVLEYFDDIQLSALNSKLFYNESFHYVPSYKYKVPSVGDERLLKKETWINLLTTNRNKVKIESFNNGFDYLIKIKSE